jgi:hypothetical protein
LLADRAKNHQADSLLTILRVIKILRDLFPSFLCRVTAYTTRLRTNSIPST